jgi:hypothetical protein
MSMRWTMRWAIRAMRAMRAMRAIRGRCSGRCLATLTLRFRADNGAVAAPGLCNKYRASRGLACLGLAPPLRDKRGAPVRSGASAAFIYDSHMAEDRPSCLQHICVRVPYPYILLGSRHRSRHTLAHCRASRRHFASSRRLPPASPPHCAAATSWAIRPLSTRVGLKTPSRDTTTEVNYPIIPRPMAHSTGNFTNYALKRLHAKMTNEPAQPVMTCP